MVSISTRVGLRSCPVLPGASTVPKAPDQYVWKGVSHTAQGWAKFLGISYVSMYARIKRHWPHAPELVFQEAQVGRYKKPEHLKKLEGTFEKRDNHQQITLTIPQGAPLPPEYLNSTAKQAWAYIAGQMEEMGILTSADALFIEMMCITYARLKQNQEVLDMRGSSTYLYLGKTCVYPEVAIVSECVKTLNAMMSKCGMSPLDRTRLVAPQKEEAENPFGTL